MDAYSSLIKQMSDARTAELRRDAERQAMARIARAARRRAVRARLRRWVEGRRRTRVEPAVPVTLPAAGTGANQDLRRSA